jgi:exopolysaccharide biosynthesis polyprenyl glycosylphosphotransferase
LATKPAATEKRPIEEPRGRRRRDASRAPADIRSARPYLLSTSPLRGLARRLASIGALLFLDISALALGLYSAFAVRELYYGRTPLWGLLWESEREYLPFLVLITVLVFWQAGLYSERGMRGGIGRVLASLVLVALLTTAFAVGSGHDFNTYGLVPTALVLTTIFMGTFRASYESITRDVLRIAGVRRRAILVGEGEHLAELHRTLGFGRSGIDYEFLGAVASSPEGIPLPQLGDLKALAGILDSRRVDELILAESDFDERQLLEIVDQAHRRAVKVRVAPKTTELLTHKAEYVPGQGVPLFELRPPVFAGADWVVKRTFDLVVSAFLLLVGLPLWLAIAAAIKINSPGPVFYRSLRVGLHEREFGMFKFRTMRSDAPGLQAELEAANEADGALFKIREDPRVTGVGRVLRRLSLDEIPNMLNVLRGEMSLVGPRPLPVRDFSQLEAWHRKRYLVLPGMTGLWQISGRSGLSFDDLVRLDFYYLENWSIWLDISILARTLPAVLARRGAY